MQGGKVIENTCIHAINLFCKQCKAYICAQCQLNFHSDHAENVLPLENIVKQSVGGYSLLVANCEKQLEKTIPSDQEDIIEKELLKVESELWNAFADVVQESNEIEALHVATLSDSKLFDRMKNEKKEFEENSLKELCDLDKKLENTISQLLIGVANEDYVSVLPYIENDFKQKVGSEFENCEEKAKTLDSFLKHYNLIKSIEPEIPHSAQILSKKIEVKGPFEPKLKLLAYDIESQAVFCYMPEKLTARKYPIVNIRIPKGFSQVAFDDDKLFICGGKNLVPQYFKEAYIFSESDEQIEQIPSMKQARAYHGICVRGNQEIYIVGGENENEESVKTAEIFNVLNRTWKQLPNTNYAKKNPALALFRNRFLYCLTLGISTDSTGIIEILDIIDPVNWTVENIIVPSTPWMHFGCVQVTPFELILFGGELKGKKTKRTQIYDIEKQAWRPGPELPSESYFNGSDFVKGNNKMFALSSDKSRVYWYDIKKEDWFMAFTEDFSLKYN